MDNSKHKTHHVEELKRIILDVMYDLLQDIKKRRKRSSPSRKRRNRLRAEAYRESRMKTPAKIDQMTQTEPTEGYEDGTEAMTKKAAWWKWWKSRADHIDVTTRKPIRLNRSSGNQTKSSDTRTSTEDDDNEKQIINPHIQYTFLNAEINKKQPTINPEQIYNDFETMLRLSRLEEHANLTIALRHLTRKLHSKGDEITFPQPEAFDRMQLKAVNLPSDPQELLILTKMAFGRRGEVLCIDELYRQLVKTHGRAAFNPRMEWPNSHCHTYLP